MRAISYNGPLSLIAVPAGLSLPCEIVLPRGGYRPRFSRTAPASGISNGVLSGVVHENPALTSEVHAQPWQPSRLAIEPSATVSATASSRPSSSARYQPRWDTSASSCAEPIVDLGFHDLEHSRGASMSIRDLSPISRGPDSYPGLKIYVWCVENMCAKVASTGTARGRCPSREGPWRWHPPGPSYSSRAPRG